MHNKDKILSKKEEISLLIKVIVKEFRSDLQTRLNDYGLTAQQGRILFLINCRNGEGLTTRLVDIEKHFSLTKSTVHGLVERMIKANIIHKSNHLLELTEYAGSIIHFVLEKRKECLDKLFANLSEEELDTLSTLLNKIHITKEEKEEKKQ